MKINDKVELIDGTIARIVDIVNEPISLNTVYLIDKQFIGKNDEKYGYNRQYYKENTWFVYYGEIKRIVDEENVEQLFDKYYLPLLKEKQDLIKYLEDEIEEPAIGGCDINTTNMIAREKKIYQEILKKVKEGNYENN